MATATIARSYRDAATSAQMEATKEIATATVPVLKETCDQWTPARYPRKMNICTSTDDLGPQDLSLDETFIPHAAEADDGRNIFQFTDAAHKWHQ